MELNGNKLKLDRKLSKLDELVLDFTDLLEDFGLDYVIVSGYVAILTGRSRGTEDVDLIIEGLEKEGTTELAKSLKERDYWCINTDTSKVYDMLKDDLAVRFAEEGKAIPNFEVRFASDEFERDALENKIKVELDNKTLYISPMELQIAYKLYLGSEKDLEDALHLYQLFVDKIDKEMLKEYSEKLSVGDKLDELEKA